MQNIDTDIDWKLFDKIVENLDLENLTMLQVVQRVYESTAMYYSLKYHEAKGEADHVTKRMVERVQEVEDLKQEVRDLRARLPEEGEEGLAED